MKNIYMYKEYIHTHQKNPTMEYYSTIKRHEIMSFAAICMDLEIITLSEINQKEKAKYHMVSFIC